MIVLLLQVRQPENYRPCHLSFHPHFASFLVCPLGIYPWLYPWIYPLLFPLLDHAWNPTLRMRPLPLPLQHQGAPLDLAFLFSLLLFLPFAPVAIVFGDGQQDGARPPEFLQSFFYYEFATKNLN